MHSFRIWFHSSEKFDGDFSFINNNKKTVNDERNSQNCSKQIVLRFKSRKCLQTQAEKLREVPFEGAFFVATSEMSVS